jgi:hypothetical protein
LGGADGDLGAPTINVKKISTTGPMGGADRDSRASTINAKKTSTVGPLGGAAKDLGASTINVKNVDSRPPGPRGGGGSYLHLRSERYVINLHGYDR